ncbi:two-component response regulator [Lachnospiraceae bacterium KM106-2]|nr:two-component response regulator [Lachnospiraceae bacterium KM106-2]
MQIITNQANKELKEHGNDQFPILVSEEQLSLYDTGSFLWHWHPEIELTFLTKGEMLYQVNNTGYHLKEGEALFTNSNALHTGSMYKRSDCQYLSVTFDPKLIYGFSQSILYQKYVEPIIHDFSLSAIHLNFSESWHESMIQSIQTIISLYKKMPNSYELDISIELQKMWKTLVSDDSIHSAHPAHGKLDYERIKEILSYLETHYIEKIRLADIADHVHLCESECSRLFKRYMNISLFTYLLEYRIERSIEYLSDSSLSITEVAANSGFTDSNYYSKTFVKLRGCSPCKYRKHLHKQ